MTLAHHRGLLVVSPAGICISLKHRICQPVSGRKTERRETHAIYSSHHSDTALNLRLELHLRQPSLTTTVESTYLNFIGGAAGLFPLLLLLLRIGLSCLVTVSVTEVSF